MNVQLVSAASNGQLVVGSSTFSVSALPAPPVSGAIFQIGSSTFTEVPGSNLVLGSTTISAGGAAATVNGQLVSVGSSGIVVGGSMLSFSAISTPGTTKVPIAVFTVGSQVLTETQGKPLVIGSQTLPLNGPAATVGGEVISVASNGVVISSVSTSSPSTMSKAPASPSTSGAVFTLEHSTYTDFEGSTLVIGSKTLSVGGPAITVGRDTISLASNGVVIDGAMISFSALQLGASPTSKPNGATELGSLDWCLWGTALGIALLLII